MQPIGIVLDRAADYGAALARLNAASAELTKARLAYEEAYEDVERFRSELEKAVGYKRRP